MRYQSALSRKHPHETFAVATFSLEDRDMVDVNLGHEVTQEVLHALGRYINKHFGAVGGFSTRQTSERFVTVLPFSELEEAQSILDDFARDLQAEGLGDIHADAKIPEGQCFEFSVTAGLAQGRTSDEIPQVLDSATSQEKTIGRFQCEMRR